MQPSDQKREHRRLVVSDLHLFSLRSHGWECIDSVRREFQSLDTLVLNGDIFDFRFATRANIEQLQSQAIHWLLQLKQDHPQCEVHYVLGNHDCREDFHKRLTRLSSERPGFQVHEHLFQLDSALFLHGDCANRLVNLRRFECKRARSERGSLLGQIALSVYLCAENAGLHGLIHKACFPQRQTVKRIARQLDKIKPGCRSKIRHCFFGHTHLPFADYEFEGIRFHNTGSGTTLGFRPLYF